MPKLPPPSLSICQALLHLSLSSTSEVIFPVLLGLRFLGHAHRGATLPAESLISDAETVRQSLSMVRNPSNFCR